MKLALALIVCLIFMCACSAQSNYRCRSTPTNWKANRFVIDYDTLRSWYSDIYYVRSTDVKVYEIVYERDSSSRIQYEEWLEFEGTSVLRTTRTFANSTCDRRVFTVDPTFRPFSVPSTDRFAHQDTFGGSLPVDFFYGSDGRNGDLREHSFWSPVATGDYVCIPVIESFVREGPSIPYAERRNIHVTYVNVTTSFDVPGNADGCR